MLCKVAHISLAHYSKSTSPKQFQLFHVTLLHVRLSFCLSNSRPPLYYGDRTGAKSPICNIQSPLKIPASSRCRKSASQLQPTSKRTTPPTLPKSLSPFRWRGAAAYRQPRHRSLASIAASSNSLRAVAAAAPSPLTLILSASRLLRRSARCRCLLPHLSSPFFSTRHLQGCRSLFAASQQHIISISLSLSPHISRRPPPPLRFSRAASSEKLRPPPLDSLQQSPIVYSLSPPIYSLATGLFPLPPQLTPTHTHPYTHQHKIKIFSSSILFLISNSKLRSLNSKLHKVNHIMPIDRCLSSEIKLCR